MSVAREASRIDRAMSKARARDSAATRTKLERSERTEMLQLSIVENRSDHNQQIATNYFSVRQAFTNMPQVLMKCYEGRGQKSANSTMGNTSMIAQWV